jgi:hypothetical protein
MESLLTSLLPQAVRRGAPSQGNAAEDDEPSGSDEVSNALYEAEEAITAIMDGSSPIALAPQGAYVRRLQHQLADRYNLGSRSRGKEPNRRVEIFREGLQ